MQKLKYTIYDALINFYRRRSVNIIVAVSFALGMLLPILCLGNINIFVENVSTMRYKNDDNVWTVSFNSGEVNLEGLLSSMEEFPLEIEDMSVSAQKRGTVEINNVKSDGFMKYVTEDWLEFDNCKVIDGSLDLFEESNVCLIEQSYADNPDEIKAGDRIKLFGKTYTVKGGDNLSKISQAQTGKPSNWRTIYSDNQGTIGSNPNLIKPGQQLKIRASY